MDRNCVFTARRTVGLQKCAAQGKSGVQPLEVGQFGNFEARMLRNFRAAVDDWDEVCSALGGWETQHLTRDDPDPTKEQHRRRVIELLSWGHLVQQATQQPKFPDKALGAHGSTPAYATWRTSWPSGTAK